MERFSFVSICACFALCMATAGAAEIHVAVRNGDKAQVERLVGMTPAVVMSQDKRYAATPLHVAAHDGHLEIASFLISRSANMEARTGVNATPLFLAVLRNKIEMVDLLLNAGAIPNAQADNGMTPLHLASLACNLPLTLRLLASAADASIRDHNEAAPRAYISSYNLSSPPCSQVATVLQQKETK